VDYVRLTSRRRPRDDIHHDAQAAAVCQTFAGRKLSATFSCTGQSAAILIAVKSESTTIGVSSQPAPIFAAKQSAAVFGGGETLGSGVYEVSPTRKQTFGFKRDRI
jgi:hypothetical protein